MTAIRHVAPSGPVGHGGTAAGGCRSAAVPIAYGARQGALRRRIRLRTSIASPTARCRRPWCPTASCRSASRRARFLGTSKEEIGKMLTDNFLSPTNVDARAEHSRPQHRRQAGAVRYRHGLFDHVRADAGQAAVQSQGRRHRPQGHRRRRGDARPLRSRLGHHGRRRQPQFPERADLHLAGRFRLLDRRSQADDEGAGLHEGVRGGRAQEPAAQSRPAWSSSRTDRSFCRASRPCRRPAIPSATRSS